MHRSNCVAWTLFCVLLYCTAPLHAHHVKKGDSSTLPVTTSSPKARELYEKGMADYENLYLERCNEDWRAAAEEQPNLAEGWGLIALHYGNTVAVHTAGPQYQA